MTTKREQRANEIENLYIKAKANEIDIIDLYIELKPMFIAFYVNKTNKVLWNFREFQNDAEQIFYLYLHDAVNEYVPGKSSFISFVHFYFKKTITDLYQINNEFQKIYKPYIKEDIDDDKFNRIIDDQLNDYQSDLNDFQNTLVSILKEPELSLILARFGFIDIPSEKDLPSVNEIAKYLYKTNKTKKIYSNETLRAIYKKALIKLKKYKYELLP